MSRIIGIRHRTKKTASGEARPTQVAIVWGGITTSLEMSDETAERDFVLGQLPVEWRQITSSDDPTSFPIHHIVWKKVKPDEALPEYAKTAEGAFTNFVRKDEKQLLLATKVPARYEGLRHGDAVVMVLGGSGDYLAYALAQKGKVVGAKVFRVPPFVMVKKRENKNDDSVTLTTLFTSEPELFYEVRPRDEQLIKLRLALQQRQDCMKARIGCDQRLRQRLTGATFTDELVAGKSFDDEFAETKASDPILVALLQEEAAAEKRLGETVRELDVYQQLFDPIKGVGPRIAAGIIAGIIDIRRFSTKAKLRAFCGVHVLADGRFPRRRGNEVANWNPAIRQALYLLADQMNRRPDSVWGKKLLERKAILRQKHPEVVVTTVPGEGGKMRQVKKYTDGHIHKMAIWYTLGKFVEWLFRQWWMLEGGVPTSPKPAPEPVTV